MGKDHYKSLGVNKAATAGGNGKGTGGIPLTGMDHYEIVGVNKVATAAGADGSGKGTGRGNGKWPGPGGVGGAKGPARAVAVVPGGAKGAAGRRLGGASAFSSTDHSTCKTALSPLKITNEYHYEEENSDAFEDDGTTLSYTHRSTIKTAVKVVNEYYHDHEEENRGLSQDGDKEDQGEHIQYDDELLAYEDNDGAEMGHGGSGEGGYNAYTRIGDDDAGAGDVDDFLNGDNYYYDVAATGFDGYYEDGGDGADGWW